MNRDTLVIALIWVVSTVVLEVILWNANIYPARATEEAEELDRAFRLLMAYSVPVFTFVATVMGYSILRFRSRDPAQEGVPLFGNTRFSVGWLIGSASLAVLLFVHPGLTGIFYLERNPNADLTIRVVAAQWHWHIEYPEYGISLQSRALGFDRMEENAELVVPVGRRVRFEITSEDVIHSFWIPAARLKQDAVPGQTLVLVTTFTEEGSFEESSAFRVQCAELCGAGHPYMNMPLRVVSPEEFEEWVERMKKGEMRMEGMEEEEGH